MKDEGVKAKAKVEGVIDRMDSKRCKNESYRRSFIVKYHDCYKDDKGEIVFVDMYQNVECFNEVARKVKAEFADGDTVMLVGRLKSRETEYQTVHFIEVEEPEDIINLTGLTEEW
jgi:single-stranded DNA-binding protein